MGKYVGYVLILMVILVALEYFEVVDVPFLELPDYSGGQKEMLDKTEEMMKKF